MEQSAAETRVKQIPRYQAIKDYILENINAGKYKPKEKVESENELAKLFNVSRLTVQRAIRDLAAEGYLTRIQGAGTFVAPQTKKFSLIEVRDIAEQTRSLGGEPSAEVLLQRRVKADPALKDLFELEQDAHLFQALLLQKSDGRPIAIEERFAVCDVFPDFLEQNFEQVSLFEYFARYTKLDIIEADLQAICPPENYRAHLQLEPGTPCLFLERRNRLGGRIVTVTRFTFTGPEFRLSSRYIAP